jgi:hypothetical protein
MVRAYRTRLQDRDGPWLGGITLDPASVYEAWCHQRGYVCFIAEIGGRRVRAGETFGAAYAIGFFDDIDDMYRTADALRGKNAIEIVGSAQPFSWRWRD